MQLETNGIVFFMIQRLPMVARIGRVIGIWLSVGEPVRILNQNFGGSRFPRRFGHGDQGAAHSPTFANCV